MPKTDKKCILDIIYRYVQGDMQCTETVPLCTRSLINI